MTVTLKESASIAESVEKSLTIFVKRLKEDKEYIDAQKRIAELTH